MGYALKYIYHDCFILETEKAVLIFDYWKDPLIENNKSENPLFLREINVNKKIYVLISHHHKDHFSRKVFTWNLLFPEITYIISKDTFSFARHLLLEKGNYKGYKPPIKNINVLTPGEIFKDDYIKVRAFDSTDTGNSYAIETMCGLKIFHAGDLNAWLWRQESSEKEITDAIIRFSNIIDSIAAHYNKFNLVMFPVDSRQGADFWFGAKYFVNHIKTDLFVPMHFELGETEKEKEQRRIDAASFHLYARLDYGAYLQLASTRSCYCTK